jgi:hypothetical protein
MDEHYGQIPCIGRWCLMFAFVTPILEGQIKNTPIMHANNDAWNGNGGGPRAKRNRAYMKKFTYLKKIHKPKE